MLPADPAFGIRPIQISGGIGFCRSNGKGVAACGVGDISGHGLGAAGSGVVDHQGFSALIFGRCGGLGRSAAGYARMVLNPGFNVIRDHIIVQVLEHEVVIAGDPFFGQMHHGTAPARCCVSRRESVRAGGHHAPHTCCRNIGELLANVVAIVECNGDIFLQQGGIVLTVHHRGHARFNRHDCGNVIGIPGRFPTGHTALGMGDKDGILPGPRIDLINRCRYRLGHHGRVNVLIAVGGVHSGVRGHLTEELFQHILSRGELRTLVVGESIVQISADAELGVPGLVRGFGADGPGHGGLSGLPAAGLVNEEHAVAHPQEQVRPTGASVRGGHPAHAGLTVAVEEHHGQTALLCRNLIEYIGVIHMGGGTFPGHIVVGNVKGPIRGQHRASGGEHPLLGDHQRTIGKLGAGILLGFTLRSIGRGSRRTVIGGGAGTPGQQGEDRGCG